MLLASISVGLAVFFLPFSLPDRMFPVVSFGISLSLAIVLAGILICCLVRFGKKGLWFFAGAPLVLCWPLYFFSMLWMLVAR